jgi:hypothetical protein
MQEEAKKECGSEGSRIKRDKGRSERGKVRSGLQTPSA